MGAYSKIEWTDNTWNPWRGCSRVSAGCDNCYMMRDLRRFGHDPEIVTRAADKTFYAPVKKARTGWKWPDGEKVFTCSWSDFFHPAADAYRDECWEIIRQRPGLTFQILTKRPERIALCLPPDWGKGYPNVWLGVTVENQAQAHLRIPYLLYLPAAKRFISVEPMLEPVKLTRINIVLNRVDSFSVQKVSCTAMQYNVLGWDPVNFTMRQNGFDLPYLDWVIVGAETGSGARPISMDWVQVLANDCFKYGTPLFVKSLGKRKPIPEHLDIHQYPADNAPRKPWDPNLTLHRIIELEESERRLHENHIRLRVALMSQKEIHRLAVYSIARIIRKNPGINSRDALDMQRFARERIGVAWHMETRT